MKKLYLLIIAAMFISFTYAQQYQTKSDAVNNIQRTAKVNKSVQNQNKSIKDAYFTEGFEGDDLGDWTTVDGDGDGENWANQALTAHGGTKAATSSSWAGGTVLTPDNWLISPSIDLTPNSSGSPTIFLEWFVGAQDQTWPSEVYRVLVSTEGTDTTTFVEVYPDETVEAGGPDGNNYWKRTADLSAYAGKSNVYVAFQHHNCTDMFMILIDDVSVYQNTTIDGGLTAITAPNNNDDCTLTNAEEVTITIFNYGGVAITDYTVTYSINGGDPVSEDVTGANIAPSTSFNYTFTQTADLSALDYYIINASFTQTDDSDGSNNNIGVYVTNGDGQITVKVETDGAGGQAWEIVNTNGDVIASHGAYQWNITEITDVCVMDNDCYTFNWTSGTENTVTISYNDTEVNQTTATEAYSVYAIGGNCSAIDANLQELTFAGFITPGINVDITGVVKNVGTDALTSFDVDYTIDGGESVGAYSVTELDIATGQTYDFTHDVVFNQTDEAIYEVIVTVSNINGETDGNPVNNELTKNINVTNDMIERTVLIEQFTTEACPNCPPVLAYIEGYYEDDNNLIILTHHAGYYTDFLTIPVHEEMTEFYNGGTYAPAGMFDRSYDATGIDPGPIFFDADPYGGNKIDERLALPAFVSVNICGTYDESTHELNATIKGIFYDNFTDEGVSLWVSEDHIAQQSQGGAPADFEHRFTSRAVISDRLGDALTETTSGIEYSKDYTFTMDAAWEFDNLFLVGFVSHLNATDVNDREIANATQIKLSEIAVCTDDISAIQNSLINIFPNPSTGIIRVEGAENSTIEVYNSLGQVITTINNASHLESVDLSVYSNGTYIVRVITGNNITVKKVSLVK